MSNAYSIHPLYQKAEETGTVFSYLCFPIGFGRGSCTLAYSQVKGMIMCSDTNSCKNNT